MSVLFFLLWYVPFCVCMFLIFQVFSWLVQEPSWVFWNFDNCYIGICKYPSGRVAFCPLPFMEFELKQPIWGRSPVEGAMSKVWETRQIQKANQETYTYRDTLVSSDLHTPQKDSNTASIQISKIDSELPEDTPNISDISIKSFCSVPSCIIICTQGSFDMTFIANFLPKRRSGLVLTLSENLYNHIKENEEKWKKVIGISKRPDLDMNLELQPFCFYWYYEDV